MHQPSLLEIFKHPKTQKYLQRSGVVHAIASSFHAYKLSSQYGVDPILACKAALLHDIGHYTWYRDGKWDYEQYKANDIHAIKGAERAHKLLIELGEEREHAKAISLAILLHTDSYLPGGQLELNPLQKVVRLADEADEEPEGLHHYREISYDKAIELIKKLDSMLEGKEMPNPLQQTS
ncbi:HD domain-containing protein [Pseudalkalibacillus salsuginis]|uniref:HD domain-containing protein n=1 Tax=Pseudalkalibacillus salsuginis TaxID=2910972 RepID=UPI001F3CBD99|nr:HD domain-containing protein [Pseudalkalibacillus salsuginis]MCF6409199.1 HD domain-containing protein [Pseudalkalibacillus salsuginis]